MPVRDGVEVGERGPFDGEVGEGPRVGLVSVERIFLSMP